MSQANEVETGQQQGATPTGADTPPVALRWEWRTFARHVALPPGMLVSTTAATPSTETYIISSRSPDNVKIRGGRFEMKRLERVDAHGFELWNPVVTAPLPVDAAALAAVWRAWGVRPPVADRPLSLEDIVRDVVAGAPWLHAVTITKRRVPLTLGGCRGEFVALDVEGERWESVAIEGEDPERVREARQRLGLAQCQNLNYPRGLAQILGASTGNSSTQREGT